MGQCCSTLKVCAHLEVVGQCGGADRLTLCLPSSRGKGGRRLLGEFSFPSVGDGAGQHRSARRTLVTVGKVTKKDGATPVRVDILAGTSLVARREFPLADLLAGLKANKIGRRSALFFSLRAGDAADGASGAQGRASVDVFYSGRLLDEPRTTISKEDKQEPAKAEHHTSLPPQAGGTQLILPPYAVYTNSTATLITEVTYCVLTPKVTLVDLGDGRRWASPHAQPRQEGEHVTPQASETVASLTQEVVHRDLGDGQRWAAPQGQSSQETEHTLQTGETPEVIHYDLGDGQRWATPQGQSSQETEHTLQTGETPEVIHYDFGDGQRWAAPQGQSSQETEHTLQTGETPEVIHYDLGDGQRWAAPQSQSSQETEHTLQTGETPEVIHYDLGDGERWAAPQAHLRHRMGEPRERSSDVMQPSSLSPSKQGKDISRGGRALVYSLLRCAQAMAFTFVMYHVTLEWF